MRVWSSARLRLTLWNVFVLALVLGGFGLALCGAVVASQSAAIDRDLGALGRRYAGRISPSILAELAGGPPAVPADMPRGTEQATGRGRAVDGAPTRPPMRPPVAPPNPIYERPLLFNPEGRPPSITPFDVPWDPKALRAAAAGQERFSTIERDGTRVRVFSAPLRQGFGVVGALQIAHPLTEQERLWGSALHTLLLLVPLALLTAGLGGLYLTGRVLQPVRQVTHAAAEIGAEDLSRRLPMAGRDELAELASTFNRMIARLEEAFRAREEALRSREAAYRKLEQAYEQQQRFTGDASHELRTPLARIKSCTSVALMGPHCAESYREALVAADQAADAMGRLVQDLLLLARSDGGRASARFERVSLGAVLEDAVELLDGRSRTPIILQLPAEELDILGDPEPLTRVVINLLENALRHTPPEGRVVVSAGRLGETVELTVVDSGEGIAPEHLPHLGERFYRVDSARDRTRGGTGLGLAICQSVVEAHRGKLTFESEVGRGTTVRILLPAYTSSEQLPRPCA